MNATSIAAVQRLFDILVKEISIVDRAANRRRFAVVKQEQQMETDGNDETTDQPTAADDSAAERTAPDNAEDNAALDAGARALEAVTSAVEAIASGASGSEQLAQLGPELTEAVDALFGKLGIERQCTETAEGDSLVDSLRNALAEIRTARGKAHQRVDESLTSFREALDGLKEVVQTLVKSIGDHTERLTRVEKQFGLPNSGTRDPKPTEVQKSEEGNWPLDLNNPVDRDIEKAVSFLD